MNKLDFRKSRVLIIGDVMLDVYYTGSVKRISPEAPVPIVKIDNIKYKIGGASNVANNIISLNGNCHIIGLVGKDQNASILKSLLDNQNISSNLIEIEVPTITKVRIIGGHQQIVRADFEEDKVFLNNEIITKLKNLIRRNIEEVDIIVISDYDKGLLTSDLTKFIISEANNLKIPTIIDPKGKEWSKYSNATYITPNVKELNDVTDKEIQNEDQVIYNSALEILKKYNFTGIMVTRSEKGVSFIEDNNFISSNIKTKEVFDVSGAGDTVAATFALAISKNINIREAVKLANLAGNIVVSKFGTAPILIEELMDAYHFADESKILQLNDLLFKLRLLKNQNKKIIFTNGCFDILHAGHISYLKKAKELGDILVLGLNSDKSIKLLKGDSRPINSEIDRAKLLESLEIIDYIIIFSEETPYNILKEIKPDVLVKGGDYKEEEIIGREFSKKTVIVDFINGYSTTTIINKIKK